MLQRLSLEVQTLAFSLPNPLKLDSLRQTCIPPASSTFFLCFSDLRWVANRSVVKNATPQTMHWYAHSVTGRPSACAFSMCPFVSTCSAILATGTSQISQHFQSSTVMLTPIASALFRCLADFRAWLGRSCVNTRLKVDGGDLPPLPSSTGRATTIATDWYTSATCRNTLWSEGS